MPLPAPPAAVNERCLSLCQQGGNGWVAVGPASKKIASVKPSIAHHGADSRSYTSNMGCGSSQRAAASEDGLTKKQRENRRKAEKAKMDRERLREAAQSGGSLDVVKRGPQSSASVRAKW